MCASVINREHEYEIKSDIHSPFLFQNRLEKCLKMLIYVNSSDWLMISLDWLTASNIKIDYGP